MTRTRRWLSPEGFLVVVLLLGVQVVLFGAYWSGATTPPWDFYSSYNTEAFAWWHDGGFLDPPTWMPYLWGGYPAVASVQNSSFYLPVGLVAEVGTFTIHAAAALQAAHVALGALGAYVLARRWVGPGAPALLALVAYSFATPFFANAQHVDIVRASAWLPWAVLIASPRWPWRRWWAVPTGAVVLWQLAVSAYPGVLVMAVYAVAVAAVIWQVAERPRIRDHLGPLAVASLAAVAMTLLKYLPNLLVRGAPPAAQDAGPVDSWALLGTLFFGHHVDFLDHDVSMRSLFVVAPVLLLAVFAPLRGAVTRVCLAMIAAAVLLGFPAPWAGLVAELPGVALSRFHLMDARAVALVPLVVLGAAGLARLLAGPVHRLRWAALAAVPALAVAVAATRPFGPAQWLVPLAVLAVSCGLVLAVPRWRAPAALALVALAGVSGVDWAHDSAPSWRAGRVDMETGLWGAPVDDLLAARVEPGESDRRPGRSAPWALDKTFTYVWDAAFYTGDRVVAGSSGLRGNPAFEALSADARDPERAWVADFFAAPGLVVFPALAADAAALADCAATGACGPGLHVTPAGYRPGEHHYRVVATEPTEVVLNEPYYPGWILTACSGGCRDLPVAMAEDGAITTEVPAGTWYLILLYETPGQAVAWRCFAAGVALALAYPLVGMVRGLWRSRGRPGDGSDVDGGEGGSEDDSGNDGEDEELPVTFYPPART